MKKMRNTLYINQPDRYLSLDGENVVVSVKNNELGRVPLHNLEMIVTCGYTGASPALMGKCAGYGISIVFMTQSGRFLARVEGETKGNVVLRREQYRMADKEKECLSVSKNIISAKLYNSRKVIERTLRDHSLRVDVKRLKQKSEYLHQSMIDIQDADTIDSVRGIEGEAASVYFSVFDDMILQQKEDFCFSYRNRRPPLDPVNALLSLAYAMQTSLCASALEAVGLDPYVGFMHTDRPGRKSLALDMVEEFRASVCDRFVLTLINKRLIQKEHFLYQEDGAVLLTDQGRKVFFEQWQNRKKEQITHPFLDESVEIGMLPYAQALLLSRFIRGDIDAYPPVFWR